MIKQGYLKKELGCVQASQGEATPDSTCSISYSRLSISVVAFSWSKCKPANHTSAFWRISGCLQICQNYLSAVEIPPCCDYEFLSCPAIAWHLIKA